MSNNSLNDLSKVYLDRVATLNTDLNAKDVKRWEDMGGPTPGNYNSTDDSAKLKQEGKDVAATSKKQVEKATRSSHFRRFGNTTPPKMKNPLPEGFSDWRSEGFFEAITTPTTDSKALRKIDIKAGINNNVEINPKLKEAVAEMGGELLGVKEETDAQLKKQEKEVYDDEKKNAQSDQVAAKEKRANMIKRQVLLKKMQAVRQGSGDTIMASYDPMEDPTFDPHEAEKTRGVSGKDNPKGGKKLKKIVKQLSKEAASYETVKKGEVLGALKRDNPTKKKPLSVKDRDKIADKVVKDKGDTSKSDDRYAYEGFSHWRDNLEEAKVDKGKSDAEKAEARNKRNTPAGQDKDTDLKTFITRKPGESLGSARSRVRRQKHDKKQAATRLAKSKERATGSLKKYDSDGDGKVRVIDAGYNPQGEMVDEGKYKSPEQSGIVTPEESERRRKKNTKIWEGEIADKLRKVVADMKAADRKLGLLPGGPDVVDLDVERQRRRKKVDESRDRAIDIVRANIIKKHGKGAIYDPKNPPKAQPKPKAKPDTRTPEQKKKDQDHANVMARYGGEANYKAGRGLGT